MSQKSRFILYGVLAVVLLITYLSKESRSKPSLPVLGSIPEFQFTDSNGDTIERIDLNDKVWVADFIFTTCTMACPVMTGNMNLIHKEYRNNEDVRIVSISVYPEYDTPKVLTDYASRYDANTDRWHFLTGPEEDVKEIILNGFKMGDYEDIIFHSERFALVDKKGQIRGYYNGMQTSDMKNLKRDMNLLLGD
jgi:protein SCO1/2|tara:strand:- start:672 stop:1250 length:579 start_codon:yes stop_codon:yes gene_type:complete